MKTQQKSFYYIKHNSNILIVDARLLKGTEEPILWNNNGLFCIISRQKVQNVLGLIKDQENLPVLNIKEVGVLHWDDGELITAKTASMLLS